MLRRARLLLGVLALLAVPRFPFAAVVINEVFFDPAGTDTGLEKAELYNPDVVAADLAAYELYPDGIGYFVFPSGFSLGSKAFVSIHLRLSGPNDAYNLYHATATSNMGNSSGSLAIFKPGGRSSSTIVDFVRYHKPGASESKTWESAAATAGLWTTGEFVDISAFSEGSSIGLAADGARKNAAAWKIYATPSMGSANSPAVPLPPPQATSTPSVSPPPSDAGGGAPRPALGADAGPDAIALAGTIVQFHGLALGLNGELLPSARFLWTFGDGAFQEGKALTHIYYFPGIYRVNLSVSSGELAGSDWRIVRVIPPAIAISEVRPGASGFVELFNAADEIVDLGSMTIAADSGRAFFIPLRTTVAGKSAIVLANAITGLNPFSSLVLRDARASILDEAKFSGILGPDASWERSGNTFIIQNSPTPGKSSPAASPKEAAASNSMSVSPPPAAVDLSVRLNKNDEKPEPAGKSEPVSEPWAPLPTTAGALRRSARASILSAKMFFAASIILGLIAASGFILLKRPGR